MRFPEDVPVLTDDVVTLRAHIAADVEPAYRMCQDPVMQKWTTIPVPYLHEHAVGYLTEVIPAGWRANTSWAWAIEYAGEYAGTVDLRDGEGGVGEVGFAVSPEVRGNGVMTRALRLVVRYAFDVLDWNRVIWRAYVGNFASRRVAWKAGFHGLVTIPDGGRSRGVRKDEWVATVGRDDELEPKGTWWTVPVVEGEGIRLRPLRESDAQRVMEACNDERTQHWLAGMPSPYDLDGAKEFISSRADAAASGDAVSWAIADAETDELLGNVSVFGMSSRLDGTRGEIGYWMHPEARGRKVMTTAVQLAIAHAFRPVEDGGLGRHRLVVRCADVNTASAHVAEVNGFTKVGDERRADPRRDGSYDNLLTYDLLATDLLSDDLLGG
ncbi:RimJ/RimL family protein N-acetyltransferase [Kribbella aluminosa]|uniref:RimJ/RimL family protein N-acetyltransferase n=1 Tax=Kribbella aluminosa TaxID=416017 RepID=A0ABS4UU71_9ACTN|nr:GNAT family N-acetyltransferase [Kribbella aluminosa]MBP2355177.1 RimJ/RimL family protein N-acetyltransferase [Kribbella aluminosa]